MAKPRVFIGSSVEGLSIAYAVQQNLRHDAESTVWDQGIFDLSSTTIESLDKVLHDSDFAIFIFSPDDLLKIRKTDTLSVRDNVMFEFGLFVGRLGRERVFFLLPQDEVFHLPTDLLGITGGKYESKRSDGSMQAATGPAANQVRIQMKSLGVLPSHITAESGSEGASEKSDSESWIQDYIEDRYSAAKASLEEDLKNKTGNEALEHAGWILLCEAKEKADGDTRKLEEFAEKNEGNMQVVLHAASLIGLAGNRKKAEAILAAAKKKFPTDATVTRALARYHSDSSDDTRAIEELQRFGFDNFPDLALDLSDALEREEKISEALTVIQRCYTNHPSHKLIRYRYARLALDTNKNAIALALLASLCQEDDSSSDYWGYLGNVCVALELNDSAMYAYKRAETLVKGKASSAWIVANIGNIYLSKGFPTEATDYLQRSLDLDKKSEYPHRRMAEAITAKSAEEKKFAKIEAAGRREILAAETSLSGGQNALATFAFVEKPSSLQI